MLCIETLVLPNTYLYTPCASCVLRMRQVARPVGQASRYARLPILAFLVQNAAILVHASKLQTPGITQIAVLVDASESTAECQGLVPCSQRPVRAPGLASP